MENTQHFSTQQIVLVIDDDVTSLKRATSILDKEYRVAAAVSGTAAFKYLEHKMPDLILLDLNMPDMDGFAVLKKLRENPAYEKIPVIFLTATQDPESEAKCLESGAVDFVTKPYVPQVFKSRVQRALELTAYQNGLEAMVEKQSQELAARMEQIGNIQNAVIVGMANLIEERDNSTGHHVKNTQAYVQMLCDALSQRGLFPNILTEEYKSMLVKAAPLHDVGKIKITDLILQKPGKLSEEEFQIIQNHPRYGADVIEDILGGVENADYLELARDVALYHHERWDGTGYPEGLRGEAIPLGARIMAIADVFDALSADRVYHRGIRSIDSVLSIIEESGGTQFDPVITEVFLSLRDSLQAYAESEGAI